MKDIKKYLLIAGIALAAVAAVRFLGGMNVPVVSSAARKITG